VTPTIHRLGQLGAAVKEMAAAPASGEAESSSAVPTSSAGDGEENNQNMSSLFRTVNCS
jgi:hypothetical protein